MEQKNNNSDAEIIWDLFKTNRKFRWQCIGMAALLMLSGAGLVGVGMAIHDEILLKETEDLEF